MKCETRNATGSLRSASEAAVKVKRNPNQVTSASLFPLWTIGSPCRPSSQDPSPIPVPLQLHTLPLTTQGRSVWISDTCGQSIKTGMEPQEPNTRPVFFFDIDNCVRSFVTRAFKMLIVT